MEWFLRNLQAYGKMAWREVLFPMLIVLYTLLVVLYKAYWRQILIISAILLFLSWFLYPVYNYWFSLLLLFEYVNVLLTDQILGYLFHLLYQFKWLPNSHTGDSRLTKIHNIKTHKKPLLCLWHSKWSNQALWSVPFIVPRPTDINVASRKT